MFRPNRKIEVSLCFCTYFCVFLWPTHTFLQWENIISQSTCFSKQPFRCHGLPRVRRKFIILPQRSLHTFGSGRGWGIGSCLWAAFWLQDETRCRWCATRCEEEVSNWRHSFWARYRFLTRSCMHEWMSLKSHLTLWESRFSTGCTRPPTLGAMEATCLPLGLAVGGGVGANTRWARREERKERRRNVKT